MADKNLIRDGNSVIEAYRVSVSVPDDFEAFRFWVTQELSRIENGFASVDDLVRRILLQIDEIEIPEIPEVEPSPDPTPDPEPCECDPSDLIDDDSIVYDKTWSSRKIYEELQAIALEVAQLIADGEIRTDKTWSSVKINSEIEASKPHDLWSDRHTDLYRTGASDTLTLKHRQIMEYLADNLHPEDPDREGLINSGYRTRYISPYVFGGVYYPQEMVLDSGWLMLANAETQDRAAPQPTAPASFSMLDVQPWDTDGANVSAVFSGHLYTFTENGYFRSARIWVPELTGDTNYEVVVVRNPNSSNPTYTRLTETVLNEDDWTIITAQTTLVLAGEELLIYLDSLNSGTSVSPGGTPADWVREADSQGGLPTAGGWNTTNQDNILRIHQQDNDTNIIDLSGVIPGSTFQFVDTGDPDVSITYLAVSGETFDGTVYTWDVTVDSTGNNGEPSASTTCLTTITVPVAASTKYKIDVDWWTLNEPTWATVQGFLQYNGVDQPGNDDAGFGVDIAFEPLQKSDDWDVVYPPAGTSGGGGGGGGTALAIQDEGATQETDTGLINFTGAGVTASSTGAGAVEVNVPGGGSGVDVEDEDLPVATATTLNFTGDGVQASDAGGGQVDILITGGGGGGSSYTGTISETVSTWDIPYASRVDSSISFSWPAGYDRIRIVGRISSDRALPSQLERAYIRFNADTDTEDNLYTFQKSAADNGAANVSDGVGTLILELPAEGSEGGSEGFTMVEMVFESPDAVDVYKQADVNFQLMQLVGEQKTFDIALYKNTTAAAAALTGVSITTDNISLLYGHLTVIGERQATVGGGGGTPIAVENEGLEIEDALERIDFVGAGVNATQTAPGEVEVEILGGGGGDISVEDDGTEIVAAASTLDFTGDGVSVTDAGGGEATINIPGNPLSVKDENAEVNADTNTLNFLGDGVVASNSGGGQVDITIEGGGDLLVNQGDLLTHNGTSDVVLPIGPQGFYLKTLPGGTAAWEPLDVPPITDLALNYNFSNDTSNTYPGDGVFKFDVGSAPAVTDIRFANKTANGFDIGNYIGPLRKDDYIIIWETAYAHNTIIYRVTGDTTLDGVAPELWWHIPVVFQFADGGGLLNGFNCNFSLSFDPADRTPAGGLTGQVLTKFNDFDYNFAWETAGVNPFPEKDDDEAIFIVAIGDKNLGWGTDPATTPTVPLTSDDYVRFRSFEGTNLINSGDNAQWRDVDIDLAYRAPTSGVPNMGTVRGSRGNLAYHCAAQFYTTVRRPVRLLTIMQDDITIDDIADGQAFGDYVNLQIADALNQAKFDWPNLGQADVVIFSLADLDANQIPAGEQTPNDWVPYRDKFLAWRDNIAAKAGNDRWIDPNLTQMYIVDPPSNPGTPQQQEWLKAKGYIDAVTNEFVNTLRADQLPDFNGNEFTSDSIYKLGSLAASAATQSPVAKTSGAIERATFTALSGVVPDAVITSFTEGPTINVEGTWTIDWYDAVGSAAPAGFNVGTTTIFRQNTPVFGAGNLFTNTSTIKNDPAITPVPRLGLVAGMANVGKIVADTNAVPGWALAYGKGYIFNPSVGSVNGGVLSLENIAAYSSALFFSDAAPDFDAQSTVSAQWVTGFIHELSSIQGATQATQVGSCGLYTYYDETRDPDAGGAAGDPYQIGVFLSGGANVFNYINPPSQSYGIYQAASDTRPNQLNGLTLTSLASGGVPVVESSTGKFTVNPNVTYNSLNWLAEVAESFDIYLYQTTSNGYEVAHAETMALNDKVSGRVVFLGVSASDPKPYKAEYNFVAWHDGSAQIDDHQVYNLNPLGIRTRITTSGDDINFEVDGANGETWDWRISLFWNDL